MTRFRRWAPKPEAQHRFGLIVLGMISHRGRVMVHKIVICQLYLARLLQITGFRPTDLIKCLTILAKTKLTTFGLKAR
jgi:hypothetical protein